MKIIFHVKSENLEKVKELANEDPIGRSSLYVKDSGSLGSKESGYYLIIDGSEENCNLAKEKLKGLAKLVEGPEAERLIRNHEEIENKAMEGFGGIFS